MAKNRLDPIPKPPGLPVLGNVTSIDTDAPLQNLMRMAEDMGPIFRLDMMGKPMVIVSGAELVKELCDETRFDKTVRGALRRLRTIGGDGLFTGDTNAPNWGKAHNILMPTFAQKAMKTYLPMMIDIAEQLMKKWERLNSDDEIDVPHDMIGLTLDTIGLCGFDYRFNSFYREGFHPYIDAMSRVLELSMKQKGLPWEDVAMRAELAQHKKDVAYMNSLVDDIIKERRKSGGDQNDLLNFMLAGVDPLTGEGLSDENIRFQINTFLIAGHETTSGLLSFTLYYLLKNPDVLNKARAEVDAVLGHDISVPPTYTQIGELEYVRAVLLEALRLWPTAPAFSVAPYKDEIIGGQYPIPKGMFTTVLVPSLHRDKSVWGDTPEDFNPDNFLPDAEAARPAHVYKPFGNGQRACIGRQFAIQEAVLVLGMILQRFQIFDPHNYQIDIKETLSLKPHDFRIKVRSRPEAFRGSGPATAAESVPDMAPEQARRPSHGTPLYVLYGSNLGTSEGFARHLAQMGEVNGFDTTLATLDDFAGDMPTDGAVLIVSSSYNGAPPNNAAKFVKWLQKAGPQAVPGLHYAIFGCGSRDWAATFQTVPRLIDERLEALGGIPIRDRGEADAREDLDGQFQEWADGLFVDIGAALDMDVDFSVPVETAPIYRVEVADSVMANPVAFREGTQPMRVLENNELQTHKKSSKSKRSTRHIAVELPEGVTYEPGDHLCVVPVNPPELVDRALSRFGFDDTTHVKIYSNSEMRSPFPSGSTFSLKRLAEVFGELQAVATRADVAKLAAHIECPHSKPKLAALAAPPQDGEDLYRSDVFLKRKSVLDLLEEFPACDLPLAIFLEMIPMLTPRYYSISSSPNTNPGQCTITVAVVDGPARSGRGTYKGVCSNYLLGSRPGDMIQAVIKAPATPFRLPKKASTPIIMFGPGTGVAPFRAFIEERRALADAGKELGDAMLFFGCRHPDQDFLYRSELEQAEKDGLVTLHTAFSRLNDDRVYVQDVLRQHQPAVWGMIEDGAVIYICGDGAAMEPDVKRALTQIYATEKDVTFAEAQAWMENMARKGRYLLDVWAGN